jgi:hypothetical protein
MVNTFRSAVFQLIPFLPILLPSDGATGLRGTFPGHPRPFHLSYTTFIHPWAPFPDGTRTRADLAVVVERVLILPSTTLPSAPRGHTHTHPWPGGGFSLGKNPPPSVRFELTSIGTATSEYFLRQPCGHRATFLIIC